MDECANGQFGRVGGQVDGRVGGGKEMHEFMVKDRKEQVTTFNSTYEGTYMYTKVYFS